MQKDTESAALGLTQPLPSLVVLSVSNRVAEQRSSANDLAHREESQNVNRVNTQLGQVLLVWLEFGGSLQSSLLLSRSLQELDKVAVNLLELGLGWWSKTFVLVDNLADLGTNLTPVNSAVGELGGFGDGTVEEAGGLGHDSRHGL